MTRLPHEIGARRPAAGWRCGVIRGPRGEAAASATPSLTVLKCGGSLLSRPDWPTLLQALVADRRPTACCLVVGGGAVVDGLRALDRTLPQAAHLVHALAIDAMRLTARLVAAAIDLPLVAVPPRAGGTGVLDVPAWLGMEPRAAELPAGWGVTSDSIAALAAIVYGADLLLAKSVPPPPWPDDADPVSAVSRAGWVDEHFPVVAASLPRIDWAAPA